MPRVRAAAGPVGRPMPRLRGVGDHRGTGRRHGTGAGGPPDARAHGPGRAPGRHGDRRHRPGARRRARPGHRGLARGGARHRQVDPSPPVGDELVACRAPLPPRLRGGVAPAGRRPGPPARARWLGDLVRPRARAPRGLAGRPLGRTVPARGRLDPGAPRPGRRSRDRGNRPGPGLHGCSGRAGQVAGHLGPSDRPRHQGRRPRRPTGPRARGGRRAGLRGRPALGPSDALRRQEPVRRRGRGRLVRDERRRVCRRSIPPNCWSRAGASPGPPWPCRRAGRRALAVEVQALVAPTEGPARRQATGLDPRRFQLVAAVLERSGVPFGRAELYGATSGGIRVEDPACDLAVAAALASAASGAPAPPASAFVGEVGLTGLVRPAPGLAQRLAAARAAGIRTVFAAGRGAPVRRGPRSSPVRHVRDALTWAAVRTERPPSRSPA